jgi:hypothetical protein
MVEEKLTVIKIVVTNEINNLRRVFCIASSSFSFVLIGPLRSCTFHIADLNGNRANA